MTIEEFLQKTSVFLLDMDGTLYLDETPIGPMKKTLVALRKAGKQLVYCTNNSSKTVEEYEQKLKRIGFWEDSDMVYTSGIATMEYLKKYKPNQTLYLMARDEVKKDFEKSGFQLTDDDPDICVLAYDTTLDFAKLRKFNECLVNGSFYVATHPDSVCPAAGISPPDVGSIIKLFECSSSRLPDVICGKPYPAMGEALLGLVNADKSSIAMVGDRLNTDIKFANNSGFTGLLVLSGETKKSMLPSTVARPDIVLDSLNDLMKYL